MVDLNVYIAVNVVVLIFTLLAMVKKDIEFVVFSVLGAIIGIFLSLGVLADGSLSEISGGTLSTIVSASTPNLWEAVYLIPVLLMLTAFMISVWKVGQVLK